MAVSSPLNIAGRVIRPGDPDYDAARAVWNGSIDRRPAAIVRCAGSPDVIAALRHAREQDLAVAVRGGGHNVAGFGTCDGGIVIDLSARRGAQVDPRARLARVLPGTTWGELDRATQAHGLIAPGGLVSMTGVAGFTLGGGIGWTSRRFGPACDSLVGAEVVTPDGDVLEASEHPDLLWALRGGGGNFGVVTRFDLRLHELGPTVLAGARAYPLERIDEVLAFHRELTATAPDDLATLIIARRAPTAAWVPEAVHGRPVIVLVACGPGARALDELGPPLADALAERPYAEFQGFFDAAWQPGFHNYWKAEYLNAPSDAGRLAACAEDASPLSDVKVMHLGGAFARAPEDSAAFAHRGAPFVLNINARWTPEEDPEPHIAWARGVWESHRPYSSGGVYVNFLGNEGQDRVRAAYGEAKYARLAALKARYDPDNVLQLNQNITPAA